MQRKAVLYDKAGDQHYDYISAWIKSTRGSDPDASLYYLAAMLEGGEDPRYIARRMIVLASEDIGNADPQALADRGRRRARGRARRLPRVPVRARPGRDLPLARAEVERGEARDPRRARAHRRARRRAAARARCATPPIPAMRKLGRGVGYENPHDEPGPRQRPGAPAGGPRGAALLRARRRRAGAARAARRAAAGARPRAVSARALRHDRPLLRRDARRGPADRGGDPRRARRRADGAERRRGRRRVRAARPRRDRGRAVRGDARAAPAGRGAVHRRAGRGAAVRRRRVRRGDGRALRPPLGATGSAGCASCAASRGAPSCSSGIRRSATRSGSIRDYLPSVRRASRRHVRRARKAALGATREIAVPIPHDCRDGFLMAYWRRPEAYLDPAVRANISVFALLPPAEVDAMVASLRADLESGAWAERHARPARRATSSTSATASSSRNDGGASCAGAARGGAAARRAAARDPRAAVAHLLAVQAQDLRAARLALRARGAAGARGGRRRRARGRLARRRVAHARHAAPRRARGPRLAARAHGAARTRRRSGAGSGSSASRRTTAERAVGVDRAGARRTARSPARSSPSGCARPGSPTEGQRVPHLLALAAGRGAIVLGPVLPTGHGFALRARLAGRRAGPAAGPRRRARRARAPLPARPRPGERRRTSRVVGARAARRPRRRWRRSPASSTRTASSSTSPAAPRRRALPPRLLPAFDPYLLGWRDRVVRGRAEHARRVHPGGGIVRATAIADGRAVATWTVPGGAVRSSPFAPLDAALEAALPTNAARRRVRRRLTPVRAPFSAP